MSFTETATAEPWSTRLFPAGWGVPPNGVDERAAWIQQNIKMGRAERALGIPVPWLADSPDGPKMLVDLMRRRLDAIDREAITASRARLRLLDVLARAHGPAT